MARRSVIAILSVLLSAVAHGQDYFSLFQPPPNTGVMKGSPGTYVTTNAAASDVITLFNTGSTCTSPSTEFLRADGNCAVPAGSGSGSVTSVNFAAPTSLFSCTGGPITGSGTITCSYATGQTANEVLGTTSGGAVSLFALTGAYVPPISLSTVGTNGGITSTLGVGNGGLGVATLTTHGLLVGEGTSAVHALTALATDTVVMGQGASTDPAGASVPNCGSGSAALSYSTSTHAFGCQTISAGTGTVTSVGMTVPSVLSVTPASITTSGTFALSFAGSQTANEFLASPSGTTGAVGLRTIVSADVPPSNLSSSANGGVTGNLPHTNLNGGVGASSATCWHGNDTWGSCGGSISSAPPSASIGLSAITGATGSYMDAGSAPALSQSISPMWTGIHLFSGGPFTASTASGGVNLGQSGNFPLIELIDTNEGTNAKNWRIGTTTGGALQYQIASDDWSTTFKNYLAVSRSAAAVTGISLSNATDNAPVTVLGTGTTTLGGNLTVSGTALTVGGHAVCEVNGTNCPAQPTPAAPTATVGPTAVAGSGTAYMLANAAPAICLTCSFTWTGAQIFAGNATGVTLASGVAAGLDGGNGSLQLLSGSGSADSKRWEFLTAPTTMTWRTLNDAFTASSVIMQASRSGQAVSALNFGNPTDNPAYSFLGAGTTTFGTGGLIVPAPSSTLTAITANAAAGANGILVQGSGTTGSSFGVSIKAGTNSTDSALVVANAANTTQLLRMAGDGGVLLASATGGDKGLGTINMTGCFVNGVACSTGTTPTSAAPSGSVGLTAITGSTGHFMDAGSAPALSQSIAPTWTAEHTFTAAGSTTSDPILLSSSVPSWRLNSTASGADAKQWQFFATGNSLEARTLSDANVAGNPYLNFARIGNVISSMSFGSTDNPTFNFLGTGTATFGGAVTTNGLFTIDATAGAAAAFVSDGTSNLETFSNASHNWVFGPIDAHSLNFQTGGIGNIRVTIASDGGVVIGSPAGGDCGAGCLNAQSIEVQGTPVLTTSGNAATASALSATPSQCSGGQFATGVTASGAANCSTPPSAIQLVAYGTFSGTCSASISKNMTCSSHTTGSGIYNLSVSGAGFPSTPVCTTSTGIAFAQFAFGSSSSTIVQIATYNISGTNTDEAFSVICVQ